MLSIYRVISLSLLMSLFFAAPLLCVHPISIQQQKTNARTTKRQQDKRVRVAWQKTSQSAHLTAADRLAGSLREAELVHEQAEKWDEREEWAGVSVPTGTGGVRKLSHAPIYH
jgi:hypothetical protein